jgi:hypothetical protein
MWKLLLHFHLPQPETLRFSWSKLENPIEKKKLFEVKKLLKKLFVVAAHSSSSQQEFLITAKIRFFESTPLCVCVCVSQKVSSLLLFTYLATEQNIRANEWVFGVIVSCHRTRECTCFHIASSQSLHSRRFSILNALSSWAHTFFASYCSASVHTTTFKSCLPGVEITFQDFINFWYD